LIRFISGAENDSSAMFFDPQSQKGFEARHSPGFAMMNRAAKSAARGAIRSATNRGLKSDALNDNSCFKAGKVPQVTHLILFIFKFFQFNKSI
jgi:hypothetical protein